MARIARVVVPFIPHHVVQRGNRRMATFFRERDYRRYLNLLAAWSGHYRVEIWAYCLMPNHVHLIAVPSSKEGLRLAIGETHRRYTLSVNFRMGWKGHLWQGRFASYPMDESHLLAAARYIELNPVRARLVTRPEDHPWSSARAHLAGADDRVVKVAPLKRRVMDWRAFLDQPVGREQEDLIGKHEKTGRPLGNENFLSNLEKTLRKSLKKHRPGPQPRSRSAPVGIEYGVPLIL